MTRTGRASGSGEAGASAAESRGAPDPEAQAPGGRDPEAQAPVVRDSGARDPEARARQICLRLLTISPRTRAQLAQAMHRGGVPDEAAEAVLNRFTDAGLIADAA